MFKNNYFHRLGILLHYLHQVSMDRDVFLENDEV